MQTPSSRLPKDLAADLRRWARQCELQAKDPRISRGERERLMTMRMSLIELAKNEEWLDGKTA